MDRKKSGKENGQRECGDVYDMLRFKNSFIWLKEKYMEWPGER